MSIARLAAQFSEQIPIDYKKISECFIVFGIDDNIQTNSVFDFFLLLAKQCLYKCKMENNLPNITIFLEGNYTTTTTTTTATTTTTTTTTTNTTTITTTTTTTAAAAAAAAIIIIIIVIIIIIFFKQ